MCAHVHAWSERVSERGVREDTICKCVDTLCGVQIHVWPKHRGSGLLFRLIFSHSSIVPWGGVSGRPWAQTNDSSLLSACSEDPPSLFSEATIYTWAATPTGHLCEFWGSRLWSSHFLGERFGHRTISSTLTDAHLRCVLVGLHFGSQWENL